MKKMTIKEVLEFVLALDEVQENVEVCEKLQKMLEQNQKKNAKSDKLSKSQQENLVIKNKIIDFLSNQEEVCRITDMCNALGYTNQKISALIRQLITEGLVERVEIKRVAYFKQA